MLKRVLKGIHNFFLIFGINISFVKRNNHTCSTLEHNSKSGMNGFYSDPKTVKNYLDPTRLRFYHNILEILKRENINLNGKSIADVGCGTGHLLSYIYRVYKPLRMVGYDFSDVALQIAKQTIPEASFSFCDIYSPPADKFDCILCTEVLEHLLHPDKAIQNLIKILLPSGILLLTVPDGREDVYQGHINFWSIESWKVFLENNSNGLTVRTGIVEGAGLFGIINK